MVSGWMLGGIVTAFLMCAVVVLGSFVIYFKKRNDVGGALFLLILGLLGAIFPTGAANMVAGVIGLPSLMEISEPAAMLVFGVLIALIDMLIRLYFISFASKSGMGKARAISLSCGYAAGQCLMPVFSLFMYIIYAVMINQGNFLGGLELGTPEYQQALEFQNDLTQAPKVMYFTASLEYLAKALLDGFVTMALVRGFLEEKKGKSFGILLGVRASYEIIFQLIYTFASKRNHAVYSEATALILSLVFSVLVIAGCIYMFRPLLKDFPVGKEPKSRPLGGRRTAGEEDRKSRQAWSEVRSMNKPKPSIAELAASGNPSDTEEAENEH